MQDSIITHAASMCEYENYYKMLHFTDLIHRCSLFIFLNFQGLVSDLLAERSSS